ncbi:MAG: amidohydrolase family protein [bacterium]
MKVVDVHVHLFPEDVVDAYMENYSAHSSLPAACRPTLQQLFREYEGIDVLKYVILQEWESTKPFESKNIRLAAESDRFYNRCYFYYINKWLAKIQSENSKLLCFGGIHPDDSDCVAELDRLVQEYKLGGLKLVPCMQHFFLTDRRLFPAYEKAEAAGMPVLVHTGADPVPGCELFGHPRDVDVIASAFPRLVIIMAHMGVPFFHETKEVLAKHENVFTDLSGAVVYDEVRAFAARHRIDPSFLSQLTRESWSSTLSTLMKDMGLERVLFGSDFPFIRPAVALEAFLQLDLPDEGKERILWKNAREILKI